MSVLHSYVLVLVLHICAVTVSSTGAENLLQGDEHMAAACSRGGGSRRWRPFAPVRTPQCNGGAGQKEVICAGQRAPARAARVVRGGVTRMGLVRAWRGDSNGPCSLHSLDTRAELSSGIVRIREVSNS